MLPLQDGAQGGPSCIFTVVPVDDNLQTWNFTDCAFQGGETYFIFVYIEAEVSLAGDGVVSGPIFLNFTGNESTAGFVRDDGALVVTGGAVNVSNTFTSRPVIRSTPMTDEVDVQVSAQDQRKGKCS